MKGGRHQSLAEPRTVVDDDRAALRHAQVKFRQSIKKRRILFAVAQNARLVLVGAVIVAERLRVARAQLAERVVHELAPRRRAVADQQQILRTEVDRAEHVAEVAPLFHGHLIDENFSSSPRGERDLEQKISVARKRVRLDAAFALAERNELFFRPRAR